MPMKDQNNEENLTNSFCDYGKTQNMHILKK